MYYYIESEPGLFTVGSDDSKGHWIPESDHTTREEAAQRVNYLNGGSKPVEKPPLKAIKGLLGELQLDEIKSLLDDLQKILLFKSV